MQRVLRVSLVAGLAILCPAALSAQTTAPTPPPAHEGSAEFSFMGTNGNADTRALGVAAQLTLRKSGWLVLNKAGIMRNETDAVVTAQSSQYFLRGERGLNARASIFADYAYFRDTFAGVERRNNVVSGVTYKLVASAAHRLSVDAGLGYLSETSTTNSDVSSGTAVFGVAYKWKMSATAEFAEDVRVAGTFENADDWRLANIASLSARLTSRFVLKVANEVRYLNRPVAGFKTTDSTTAVSLVAKF